MKKGWTRLPFIFSLLFLTSLVAISFLYTYVLKDHIKSPPTFLYDGNGNITKMRPFPPSFDFPFGVDRLGNNLFWLVIDGAKYTILIGLSVSLLRVGLSVFIGIIYGIYLQKMRTLFTTFERAFRFIPAILLVMLFFDINLFSDATKGFSYIVSIIFWLTIVSLPSLVHAIGNEVSHFSNEDFITASRAIGATKFRIIRKHVMPFLRSRILLMIVQQMISVLLLLIHLGVFRIFVGGSTTIQLDTVNSITFPNSNEWSSLIGVSYKELMLDQWIVFGPSIAFILTLIAFNVMKRMLEVTQEEIAIPKNEKMSSKELNKIKKSDFAFKEAVVTNID
ncbi:peptide ABC transporter permease [Bacillus sp. AFS002410]|uniref:ABC transporter permease subunit n=1 Tax=Bacillus sp. AFS002410 TaxID=2033481 RepID=UPI000BEF5B1F|nr:ABC transporter permease subunit [Bacillus sp. AFS002410]PEJ59959.1 peptide ABC transporter permease [Bacillus sp. AFS002410]